MKTACKSMAIIGVLIATLLTVSCGRERSAAATANTASAKEAPPAIRYEDHIWAAGLPPPAGDLSRSEPSSPQSAKDGEALFTSMNCDSCHASDGSGQVGPSLSDGRWRYGGRDEEIFESIFYGRPRGMPAYGGLLGQGGVWLVVSFLKSLPKPESVPTVSAPESLEREGHPGRSGTAGAPTQ
jgi:cytochrome c oxidase cbb3-type subunit 3